MRDDNVSEIQVCVGKNCLLAAERRRQSGFEEVSPFVATCFGLGRVGRGISNLVRNRSSNCFDCLERALGRPMATPRTEDEVPQAAPVDGREPVGGWQAPKLVEIVPQLRGDELFPVGSERSPAGRQVFARDVFHDDEVYAGGNFGKGRVQLRDADLSRLGHEAHILALDQIDCVAKLYGEMAVDTHDVIEPLVENVWTLRRPDSLNCRK